jgi:hypothetical protein
VETLEQILENAHALFQQRVAQEIAADDARQAEEDKRLARERAELREWLVQFIPQELMQYVDTSGYSHNEATRSNHRMPDGALLEIHVPGAAQIRARIQKRRDGFSLNRVYNGGDAGFVVPTSWRIKSDPDYDNGRPYVEYGWGHGGVPKEDFMLILGAAVDFWREHSAAIERALAQKAAERRLAEVAAPVTREGLSLISRQVIALEAIADALSYNSNG